MERKVDAKKLKTISPVFIDIMYADDMPTT